jgi:hypothetical protein
MLAAEASESPVGGWPLPAHCLPTLNLGGDLLLNSLLLFKLFSLFGNKAGFLLSRG